MDDFLELVFGREKKMVQDDEGVPVPTNVHDAHAGPCPKAGHEVGPQGKPSASLEITSSEPLRSYTKAEMAEVMSVVFRECEGLRGAGQKEYAHADQNAFANFDRVSERLGLPREAVLMVYAEKHLDGIHSWIKGHRSQRESVKGRINDVIVYMCLLRGMVECREQREETRKLAGQAPMPKRSG